MAEQRIEMIRKGRNWWKAAFFVTLLAFEFAREWAVVASHQPAQPAVMASLTMDDDYASAVGRWRRIDDGGSLVPATVSIQCRRETGQCIEATALIMDQLVMPPTVDLFPARFGADAISYENDVGGCARYAVRLDRTLNKALAVRTRDDTVTDPRCQQMERRIETQLGDGFDADENPLEGHFVPLFSAIAAFF